ncbi:hypothetical protein JD844_019847, partial [Phrynosoma platyrhinos]
VHDPGSISYLFLPPFLFFYSTNTFTTELLDKALAYFHAQNVIITYSNIQVSVKNYLENLLYHPKVLLSEFQQMNRQRFQTAMKYLFGNKQDYLELGHIVIDLAAIREKILQSPGGNRTLFLITLERCFLILDPAECVNILSQILRSSSIMYLQAHTVSNFPKDLPEDAFRNLSSVFKDLYDRITASSRRALYDWMMRILQKSYNTSDSENVTSWVSAENLWILGRYMVHLPLEEIRKINPYEMRLFISYDNATKQLDTVYDITPDLAQAFLERINASGFDMRNTSTLYRQVILFKLKSQLLDIAMQNQTLNDTLGSLSDAVVGLSTSQLESLSPEAVHNAIPTLNQVSGWAKSQIMILSSKYLMYEKVLSFHNISQMGALVTGISTQSFHSMNPKELSQVIRGALAECAADLSPAQRQGILRKILASTDLSSVIADMQEPFFKELSLFDLWNGEGFNSSLVKKKELRPSQVMNINCLAWKYWTISNTSVPSNLLALLPAEYLESITGSLCVPFITSLRKIELDHLILNAQKKKAILEKVQDCLNSSVINEYDVDLIGNLICHLPPTFICEGISLETAVAALHQFRQCQHLSYEQKTEIKHRLVDLYGSPRNWTAETTQDIGPFIALLPKAELNILVEKFPDIISEIASKKSGPIPLSEELLLAYFECIRNSSIPFSAPDLTLDCAQVVPPSSDEVMKLSEANVFWSVRELICMDPGTFEKTVELLGSVSSFNASQLAALKEKAKQVSYKCRIWGKERLQLDSKKLQMCTDLKSLARSILQGFLEDSGQGMGSLKSFDLVGLGANLCALNSTEIAAINATEFRYAILFLLFINEI